MTHSAELIGKQNGKLIVHPHPMQGFVRAQSMCAEHTMRGMLLMLPALLLHTHRPIRYWTCHAKLPDVCYAATTGGVDRTTDKGDNDTEAGCISGCAKYTD